jgi:hypothetical protein
MNYEESKALMQIPFNCSEFIVKQFMEIWRNSDRNKRMENVKSSGFSRKKFMPLAVHLVRFIYIWSRNMKFWAKRICCWIYLYIFNHLWNGFTISSFYVQIVWRGGHFCAVKEIFLIFMLWNYMHRDVVSFRIGLGLL